VRTASSLAALLIFLASVTKLLEALRARRLVRSLLDEALQVGASSRLPNLSVVVPARNEERKLEEALRTVLGQAMTILVVFTIIAAVLAFLFLFLERKTEVEQVAYHVGHLVRGIEIVDGAADDVLQRFGELAVVVRADSVTRLEGATITVSEAGLSIDNPNSPSPKIPAGGAGLEGPVAERVRALLDTRINPAIASHGGVAELVAVEGDTVYLRLGGGCQGCGLAQVTLSQGIEVAIKDAIPEIVHVVDVTDHASGENPYFESSKK